jgi:hypothetical protein
MSGPQHQHQHQQTPTQDVEGTPLFVTEERHLQQINLLNKIVNHGRHL